MRIFNLFIPIALYLKFGRPGLFVNTLYIEMFIFSLTLKTFLIFAKFVATQNILVVYINLGF